MKIKSFLDKNYVWVSLAVIIVLSGIYFLFFYNKQPNDFIKPSILSEKDSKKTVYGFLPYWTIDKYEPNYNAITDLAYFSLFLKPDGSIKKVDEDGNLDPSYNNWKNNKKLQDISKEAKENNVKVHITLALHENEEIEEFLNCKNCWVRNFVEVNEQIENRNIDGINYDFEYTGPIPETLDRKYADYVNYMSGSLKSQYGSNFKTVVSTFGNAAQKERLMNIEHLNNELIDYLFIMAYDFYSANSETSGPVAPIEGAEREEEDKKYNYDLSLMILDYEKKIPPNKLILGIPFYGYNWLVEDTNPYSKRIPGDDFIGYSIAQHYDVLLDRIEDENLTILWDENSKSPYFNYIDSKGNRRQVFFENETSIKQKILFAEENNLSGIGVWALGYDGRYKELSKLLEDYLFFE